MDCHGVDIIRIIAYTLKLWRLVVSINRRHRHLEIGNSVYKKKRQVLWSAWSSETWMICLQVVRSLFLHDILLLGQTAGCHNFGYLSTQIASDNRLWRVWMFHNINLDVWSIWKGMGYKSWLLATEGWNIACWSGVRRFFATIFIRKNWCYRPLMVSNSHISRAIIPPLTPTRMWIISAVPSLNRSISESGRASLLLHFLWATIRCLFFATPGTFSFAMYLSNPSCRNITSIHRCHGIRAQFARLEYLHSVGWCIMIFVQHSSH